MGKFVEENRAGFLTALHMFLTQGAHCFPAVPKPNHLQDGKLVSVLDLT